MAGPRLLDQVRDVIRTKHYSIRTEEAYIGWIRRYILFHGKRHPREMSIRRSRTKGPHDLHIHLNGARTVQHAGEHGNPLLREGIGRGTPAAPDT